MSDQWTVSAHPGHGPGRFRSVVSPARAAEARSEARADVWHGGYLRAQMKEVAKMLDEINILK